jgi:hypothetical protein
VRIDAYDTGFVDLAGDQGLLGQVEGRTSGAVVEWLRARTPAFPEGIRYVAINPAAVYAKAIRTERLLPPRQARQRLPHQGAAPDDLAAEGPARDARIRTLPGSPTTLRDPSEGPLLASCSRGSVTRGRPKLHVAGYPVGRAPRC